MAGSLGFTLEPVKQHDRAIYLDMQVGIWIKVIHLLFSYSYPCAE